MIACVQQLKPISSNISGLLVGVITLSAFFQRTYTSWQGRRNAHADCTSHLGGMTYCIKLMFARSQALMMF